jgi:hypothetical protein
MSATLRRMYDAAQTGAFIDLLVTCGSPPNVFGVHFAVVAAECGYFRTLYTSLVGTRPTQTSLACAPTTFERVLRCIYLAEFDASGVHEALDVLALGVFLDCDVATRMACNFIERAATAETALECWQRASGLGAPYAVRVAVRAVAKFLPHVATTPPFLALDKTDLIALLSSDELCVLTEAHVAQALCAWCEANAESCSALDHVVRFPWRECSPRESAPNRGILVLSHTGTLHFLHESGEWTSLPSQTLREAPFERTEGRLCHLDGATYVLGRWGIDRERNGAWCAYDRTGRSETACASHDARIYVAGGISGVRACGDVDVHDVRARLKGKMFLLRPRRMCCAAYVGDGLLVFGGIGAAGDVLSHAELLSEFRDVSPPMHAPRAAAACAVIGSDVYVAGGIGGMHADVSSAERFDARRNKWHLLPPMPRSRSYCAGAAMGNFFYVLGGTEYGVAASTYLRFDVEKKEWSVHDAPPLGECSAAFFDRQAHSPSATVGTDAD